MLERIKKERKEESKTLGGREGEAKLSCGCDPRSLERMCAMVAGAGCDG